MKEHEFYCGGEIDEGTQHERWSVVLLAKIGTAPAVPNCPTCGKPAKKHFGNPQINYAIHWHWAQRNQ